MKAKHFSDVEKIMATTEGARGAGIRWLLGPDDDMPNFHLRLIEVDHDGQTMHHQHPYEHEVYVLEGEGELIGPEGKTLSLEPGVAAYVPPDGVHQFRNVGAGMLRFLCIIPRLENK
jgi:quercetin dioxygenase-like cupin family protein